MKITSYPRSGGASWNATGDTNEPEMSGIIFYFSSASDGKISVGVEPNSNFRLDSIAQGDRSKNPYLSKDSLFPLLYLLPQVIDPKGTIEFLKQDILEQLKRRDAFVKKVWWNYCMENWKCSEKAELLWDHKAGGAFPSRINDRDLYEELDLDFNPTCEDSLCNLAKDLLAKILLDAAGNGAEGLKQIASAAKAIDTKTSDLFPPAGDYRINDSDSQILQDRKHMFALIRAVKRSGLGTVSERDVISLFVALKSGDKEAERRIAKLQADFDSWLSYQPEYEHRDGEAVSFLEAIRELVIESNEIPTQKAVEDLFFSQRAGRSHENFKRLRDRLGFKWLPTAKRGRKPKVLDA